MPRSVTEVIIGTGTLWTGSSGGTFPATPADAVPAVFAEIGYTEEGWTLGVDKTFENVFVAEELDPIITLKTEQLVTISGELAQPSLVNLQLAFGGGTIAASTVGATDIETYTPPAATDFTEKAVLFRVPTEPTTAPRFRDYQVPRSIVTGAFEMQYAKAPQKVLVGIEFQGLVPVADLWDGWTPAPPASNPTPVIVIQDETTA